VRALAAAALALVLAAPALAGETRPTLADLEDEVVCPTCAPQTLDQSNSPIALRMKRFIAARIAAGDTKSEIKAKLVDQFGERVLAAPTTEGFNLLAWVLPLAGIALGAGVLGLAAWRWSWTREPPPEVTRGPSPNGRGPIEPELERRLDEELARFDA
jgi:cytochrome c-type biogenesis protein CcmH